MIDKQQLQAMGEHQAEQHMCMAKQIEDLQARLQECANGAAKMQGQRDYAYKMMGKFGGERDELARQLKAANQQIALMAELLSDSCDINKALGFLIDLSENDGKEDALSILSEHLDKCESLLSSELSDHFAGTGNQPEPPAWRNTGHPNGLKRFLTQKQYEAQTPGVQQWFEPIGFNLPDGWQIVPVEPTQEMVEVGCEHEGSRINDGAGYARVLYAKMLAAAPKPEQTK